MNNNGKQPRDFSYTYSAKEQAEIKRIREKYTAGGEAEDKMARLRRLDASVTEAAQAAALIFGVVGALLLGLGMSLILSELAAILGWHRMAATAVGIVIGVIGGVLASLAYPIYNAVTRAMRKKLAPEILRLTEELMK